MKRAQNAPLKKGGQSLVRVRLGKARGEHNESGIPQKAEVVGTLSHFRVGPSAVVVSFDDQVLSFARSSVA